MSSRPRAARRRVRATWIARRARLAFAIPALCGLAVAATRAAAQTAITGVVRSRGGEPLLGAQLHWVGEPAGAPVVEPAITGADGRFRLEATRVGAARLAVRRIGFRAETLAVDVPGPAAGVVLPLEPLPVSLSQVTVRADRDLQRSRFPEFDARRSRGFGTFITRADITFP